MTIGGRGLFLSSVIDFSTLTTSYADVGSLPHICNRIEVVNGTDTKVSIAIGADSTAEAFAVLGGGSTQREMNIKGAIRIKYLGDAPTYGDVAVSSWFKKSFR